MQELTERIAALLAYYDDWTAAEILAEALTLVSEERLYPGDALEIAESEFLLT